MNLNISRKLNGEQTAGGKAPGDVNQICHSLGWQEFQMLQTLPGNNGRLRHITSIRNTLFRLGEWATIGKTHSQYILYQHPMLSGTRITAAVIPRLRKYTKCKVILLIHDLYSLRFRESSNAQEEITLCKECDYVICHNARMKEYLISKGVSEEKLIDLKAFDYLCDAPAHHEQTSRVQNSVSIAGNLMPEKSGYINKFMMANPSIKVDLYGVGYCADNQFDNCEYHGSFAPEELPSQLQSTFGLVWDGPEITSCVGEYGEYMRYNNPHKLSLYMAAGMPVITWKEAAIADFVETNHVGITVDSLENLSERLDAISDIQYADMKRNAEMIGGGVRSGTYLRAALQKIYELEEE